jgi:general secretion pathway protein D
MLLSLCLLLSAINHDPIDAPPLSSPATKASVKEPTESSKEEPKKEQSKVNPHAKSREEVIWHHPNITIEALIREYGQDQITYIIPPEIGELTVSIEGHRPIPASLWPEFLETILRCRGIYQHALQPNLKELLFIKDNPLIIEEIFTDAESLDTCPSFKSIALLLPLPLHWNQIEASIGSLGSQQLQIQQLGSGSHAFLMILGQVEWIKNFYRLLHFIQESHIRNQNQNYRFVHLQHIRSQELEEWLTNVLGLTPLSGIANESIKTQGALGYLTFPQFPALLCLTGPPGTIEATGKLIQEVERELAKEKKKAIFSFTPKHTLIDELANSLESIYNQLITKESQRYPEKSPDATGVSQTPAKDTSSGKSIIDKKTGTLMLVVDPSQIPLLEELARKLDIPKQMVQIDVILAERRIKENNDSGLNSLELGRNLTASNRRQLEWKGSNATGGVGDGILKLMLSSRGTKGYNLIYQLLMKEDRLEINSNPSIMTLNQTPASIEILSEQSINMGSATSRNGREEMRTSYMRTQYGIYLTITPTVHGGDSLEKERYLTLQTEIRFEDVDGNNPGDEKPLLIKRKIKNEVRIADGQTVILGGLKKKNKRAITQKVPLIGEVPGIGALFNSKNLTEEESEMIIFLTPHICQGSHSSIEALIDSVYNHPGDFEILVNTIKEVKRKQSRQKPPRFIGLFSTAD